MAWSDKIYSYCERGSDPSFWAEPVNAISNGAFLVAALGALVLWAGRARGERRIVDLALVVLVFGIGIGSFLFHTYATRWAVIADVLPITVFMLAYVGYALRRFMGVGWVATLSGVGLFYLLLWQVGEMRCDGVRCLNGSVGYLPGLVMLVIFGVSLMVMRRPAGLSLLAAGGIFAVSLMFRTFDKAWCGVLVSYDSGPLGTHFLWHCLNALLLFVLLRAAVLYGGAGVSREQNS